MEKKRKNPVYARDYWKDPKWLKENRICSQYFGGFYVDQEKNRCYWSQFEECNIKSLAKSKLAMISSLSRTSDYLKAPKDQ